MPLLKPNVGRALSAVGAVLTILSLFMVWYEIARANGVVDDSTGWQTFTNLRFVILGAAIVTLGTAAVAQTRPVLVVRTLLGLLVAVLILRRIIDPPGPPEVTDPVSSQLGVWFGLVGALMVAIGGLVDTGRRVVEVYPNLWRPTAGELGRGRQSLGSGDERNR